LMLGQRLKNVLRRRFVKDNLFQSHEIKVKYNVHWSPTGTRINSDLKQAPSCQRMRFHFTTNKETGKEVQNAFCDSKRLFTGRCQKCERMIDKNVAYLSKTDKEVLGISLCEACFSRQPSTCCSSFRACKPTAIYLCSSCEPNDAYFCATCFNEHQCPLTFVPDMYMGEVSNLLQKKCGLPDHKTISICCDGHDLKATTRMDDIAPFWQLSGKNSKVNLDAIMK